MSEVTELEQKAKAEASAKLTEVEAEAGTWLSAHRLVLIVAGAALLLGFIIGRLV